MIPLGLLVCDGPEICAIDQAWVESIGGGGPGGVVALDFSGSFGVEGIPDGLVHFNTFRVGLEELERHAAAGQWRAAAAVAENAITALWKWRGTVAPHDLFAVYFLQGAALLHLGEHDGYAYSFREAAALADGLDLPLPIVDEEVRRAWIDEQRKLIVGGRGTLQIEGAPAGAVLYVDGRRVNPAAGATPVSASLLAGNHRVTAIAPGRIRTWRANVPVLPGRTSTVSPAFTAADDDAHLLAGLEGAFTTLDAPETVKDMLVAWCGDYHVDEVRLMRVEEDRQLPAPTAVTLSAAPSDRPTASAGEWLDMGDAIPTTFEGGVVDRVAAAAEGHVVAANRLRVVFFDPVTRRFSVDSTATTTLRPGRERLRVGVQAGYLTMADRHHVGGDLTIAVPLRPVLADGRVEVEGQLGVVRADAPYNLYKDWTSHQLYHVALGARWSPTWSVAPFVGAGAEVYVPLAVGARLETGVQARFAEAWRFEGAIFGGFLDVGVDAGVGLTLSRGL